MAHGRRQEQWDHTAQILAHLTNLHRKKGSKAVDPREIHPYAEHEVQVDNEMAKAAMKSWIKKGKRRG